MTDRYFKLFASCVPVKGFSRSVICDLQRRELSLIPNELYDIVTAHSSTCESKIKEFYGEENAATVDEYFNFLIAKDFGFWCKEEDLKMFPPLSLDWEFPGAISNAIIDFDEHSNHDLKKIFSELEDLGCKDIELRCFNIRPLSFFQRLEELMNGSRIKSCQVITKYNPDCQEEDYLSLVQKNFRMYHLIVFGYKESKVVNGDTYNYSKVMFTTECIESSAHCGIVDSAFFTVNTNSFTESLNYNSCLNRKISVDIRGNIKNCPSMKHNHGNVKETSLHSAVIQKNFKDLWDINKDKIEVCKDCEFRHVCTDCRAYVLDESNIYSKPSKCAYDPYTATWAS
jgi:SPASM domain peptide maturase of grasp-with-spasm system